MYKFLKGVVFFVFKLIYKIDIKGIENIPNDSAVILSANHIHIFDPVILSFATNRKVIYVAKKEIFENKMGAYIFNKLGVIPIDRENADITAIKRCFKVLRNNGILGIFPEGTRVKYIDINNMKKGVALIALKNNVDIVPIHIDSNYKIFSKINVEIYEPLKIENYKNIEEESAIIKLTDDLFSAIYKK